MSFLRTALRAIPKQRATLIAPRSAAWARQSWAMQRAAYSASAGLSRTDIESRILDVLKSFEKVEEGKVSRITMTTERGIFNSNFCLTAHRLFIIRGRPWLGQSGRCRGRNGC